MIDNIAQLAPYIADEDKAREMFENIRWPEGPYCPHCGSVERVYKLTPKAGSKTRKGLYKCGECRKQFTVTVGTVFEGSRIPLGKWLYAIYLMCSSKKGVSAKQLQRELGVSYKASWFMCHRVRLAMAKEPLASKLGQDGGIVEIDETFVGGKKKNNLHRNRTKAAGKKIAVMTLIDRDGEARTFKVPNTRKGTLQAIAIPNIDSTAHIITDEHQGYTGIEKHFGSHHTVNHSETFVRGLIFHTNFAESYHSLLKRSIIGTHHHVSEKHLSRYLREREFHWNRRDATNGERTVDAIRGAAGKRLMYQRPTTD